MTTPEGAFTPGTYRERVAPLVAAYLEGLGVLNDLLSAPPPPEDSPDRSPWKIESATAMEVLWRAAEQLVALEPVPAEHAAAAELWPQLSKATRQLVMALAHWSDNQNPAALKVVVERVGELRPLATEVDRLFPEATAGE
ncbi:MAG: hypothetical protein CL878_03270 [Dehalococcoidia bacterium]|nr:hypothetical protein [Dehalococcoidia bacterium]